MSYNSDETSVDQGEPIELFEFVTPTETFRYTSWIRDVQIYSDTYQAIPIQRGNVQGAAASDIAAVVVELPVNNRMVEAYAFDIAPRSLQCVIKRMHSLTGEIVVYWKGAVTSISVAGRTAKLQIPSRFTTAMKAEVPNVYYQTMCNHVLYSGRCGLNRDDYKLVTTVASYSAKTLVTVSNGGYPDGAFKAGEVLRLADGERRLIVGHAANTMILNFPFREMLEGDELNLFLGCDHLPATCRDKFNNVINGSFHPFIPTSNLFETGAG